MYIDFLYCRVNRQNQGSGKIGNGERRSTFLNSQSSPQLLCSIVFFVDCYVVKIRFIGRQKIW